MPYIYICGPSLPRAVVHTGGNQCNILTELHLSFSYCHQTFYSSSETTQGEYIKDTSENKMQTAY